MTVTATTYGRSAAVALHARLRAIKGSDPLTPVTIVVPSNHAGLSVRRLLGSGELGPIVPGTDGIVGLQVTTLARLADTIGAPVLQAAGRRPATTPIVAATVRAVLDFDPGVFASVADHAATVEGLVAAHRELASLPPADLDRLAGTGPRAADVVRVHRGVTHRLAGRHYEPADLIAAATDAAPTSPAVADLGSIILHLPQRLSTGEAALLQALGARAELHVILGLTGHPAADAEVQRATALLGHRPVDITATPPVATTVIDASDAEEECRSAVDAVAAALRGTHSRPAAPERIAVLYPSADPYARALHAELDAAGITWNGQRTDPVVESSVGRWTLGLLRLAARGWRRADVMRLLAEAPVVHHVDGTPRRVPVGQWERLSREAGITAGKDTWDPALRQLEARHRAVAATEAAGDQPQDWLVQRATRQADAADALRRFIADLHHNHDTRLTQAETWTELADGLRHLLTTLLDSRWERWPDHQRVAAERVDLAVRRLAALDDIDDGPTPDLDTCAEILERDLTDDLGRHGTFGRGVLVAPISAAVGLDLDVVIVMGMAEGVMPAAVADDPLLHDDEREVLDGALALRRDRVHRQHRQVVAALAASRGQRVITRARGDLRRSAEREPSRWLADHSGPHRVHIPSFAARVATATTPSTAAGHRLGRLHRDAPEDLESHQLVAADPILRRGAGLVSARRGPAFGRFDGNLSPVADLLPRLDERPTSASRLETWAGCPHQYLLRHILRVEPLEIPEARLDISALDRGTLVHDVLEEWLAEQIDAAAVPPPTQPWSPTQRRRLLSIAAEACDTYVERGLTGHPTLWAYTRRQILRDLAIWLDEDDRQRRAHDATPVAVELGFGGPDEHTPDPIVLPDGTALRVRGRVDRVDRTADGRLRILDYKTGRALRESQLEDPVRAGQSLQLSLYARALQGWAGTTAEDHRADYWYITEKGGFASVGIDVDDTVRRRQEEVLGVIVDGIHQGMFVANPDRTTTPWVTCWYCDPDGLGTAELGARFEQLARTVPHLRRYVEMVDPDLLTAEGL